MIMDWK